MPKVIFYRNIILWIISVYLTIFVIGFARYELSVLALDNKITRLFSLAEANNNKFVFERIPYLQQEKVPLEPIIYKPSTVWHTFNPKYNQINRETVRELAFLIVNKKQNLQNLNLKGVILRDPKGVKHDIDLSNSHFHEIDLFKADLSFNNFCNSEFSFVDFWAAELIGSDLSFSKFTNSDLMNTNFYGSNLCGVEFKDSNYSVAILSRTNLVGVDLSKMPISKTHAIAPNLQGALYNSKPLFMLDDTLPWQFIIKIYPSCFRKTNFYGHPPTKFPKDFIPEDHGMIDIFKIPDEQIKYFLDNYSCIHFICKPYK